MEKLRKQEEERRRKMEESRKKREAKLKREEEEEKKKAGLQSKELDEKTRMTTTEATETEAQGEGKDKLKLPPISDRRSPQLLSPAKHEDTQRSRASTPGKDSSRPHSSGSHRSLLSPSSNLRNLALKCKAWASGVFDPTETGRFGPENAVDGDPNTQFCGHPPEKAWIALDLGDQKEIHIIRIRFERAAAKEYKIEVSSEAPAHKKWKLISIQKNGTEGWNEVRIDPPVEARYLKVAETKAIVQGWGMTIWELQVLGKDLSNPSEVLPNPESAHTEGT
jgi:hypothetical protein